MDTFAGVSHFPFDWVAAGSFGYYVTSSRLYALRKQRDNEKYPI